MKTTLDHIPEEISAAAQLVSDWFKTQGFDHWELMDICSRDHAGPLPAQYAALIDRTIERTCVKRVEEIEGRMVTADEVKEHGRMEVNEVNGYARYLWKDVPMCEYIPAGMTAQGFRNASITEITPMRIFAPFVK